jgi:hypothetical protein
LIRSIGSGKTIVEARRRPVAEARATRIEQHKATFLVKPAEVTQQPRREARPAGMADERAAASALRPTLARGERLPVVNARLAISREAGSN